MKLSNPFYILLGLSTLNLVSCKKNAENSPPPTNTSKHTDVYVAGYNKDKIVYWKNGVETTLAMHGPAFGAANGIVVSGKDVFVAGKPDGSCGVLEKRCRNSAVYSDRWL
jgi:hypothetical protein